MNGVVEESAEAKSIKRIFKALKDDALYKQLTLPKGITQDARTGNVMIAFAPCDPGIGTTTDPCKTDTGTGPVDVKYTKDADGNIESYPGPEGPLSVTQGGKYLRLHHSGKGDMTDEGRGVALFDNFTANNAKRVAQELVDFPQDPVDIRFVALAIAKNCVTANTLGKYAPKEALIKLFAFHGIDMTDPNDKPFDKLLADTRTRMESLPKKKADLEIQNLKGLIEANGDGFTPERVTANIARRSKVNSDETFNPDKNTLFMIDREYYDVNTHPDPPKSDNETMNIALFRLYLEPLDVAVDTWSMGAQSDLVNADRNTTYTFGDLFRLYVPEMKSQLQTALGLPATVTCSDLAAASIKEYVKLVP